MSKNSIHQNNNKLKGGFYADEIPHKAIVEAVKNKEFKFRGNSKNAGNTSFDEASVQVGYMKSKGQGNIAGLLIGYSGTAPSRTTAVKTRVRNMGPWKLREMHKSMKKMGLVPPPGTGISAENGGGTLPIFFAFERLLQLFFEDYKAIEIPQRIRNWVPEEGSFWAHWWKER